MPTAELRLPPEPSSVGTARHLLRETLERWHLSGLEFAAAQALTEIATNAVIHARTDFSVVIEWDDEVLRVCVHDHSPRLPMPRSYGVDATTGRGLAMVARLCRSWGVESTDDGKQVWFEVAGGEDAGEEGDLLAMFADDLDDVDLAGGGASPRARVVRTPVARWADAA